MTTTALSDPRSSSQAAQAAMAEAAGRAVVCRYCGEPNGVGQEGCVHCGGPLRPTRDEGVGTTGRPSAVWLSPRLLDPGARAELTRILRLDGSLLEGGGTAP